MNNTEIDLSQFTFFSPSIFPTRRQRVSQKRLKGGEISCPAPPISKEVNKWNEMIQCGELSLGTPCVPYNVTKVSICDGKVVHSEIPVYGRKISDGFANKAFAETQEMDETAY